MGARLVTTLLLLLILTGCGKYTDLELSIKKHNERVESVLTSYEKAKELGNVYSFYTRSFLLNESLDEFIIDSDILTQMTPFLEESKSRFHEYLEYYQSQLDELDQDTTVIEPETILSNTFTTRYFLDDNTGQVEQLIYLQLPNGYYSSVTLHWLGGELLEVEEVY